MHATSFPKYVHGHHRKDRSGNESFLIPGRTRRIDRKTSIVDAEERAERFRKRYLLDGNPIVSESVHGRVHAGNFEGDDCHFFHEEEGRKPRTLPYIRR